MHCTSYRCILQFCGSLIKLHAHYFVVHVTSVVVLTGISVCGCGVWLWCVVGYDVLCVCTRLSNVLFHACCCLDDGALADSKSAIARAIALIQQ